MGIDTFYLILRLKLKERFKLFNRVGQVLIIPLIIIRSTEKETRCGWEKLFSKAMVSQYLFASVHQLLQLLCGNCIIATVILALLDVFHKPVMNLVGFTPIRCLFRDFSHSPAILRKIPLFRGKEWQSFDLHTR